MFLTYFGQNNTETEQQHPFHPSFYTSTQEDNFWGCGVTHSIQLCPSLPQGLILLRLQCLIVGIYYLDMREFIVNSPRTQTAHQTVGTYLHLPRLQWHHGQLVRYQSLF